MSQQGVVDQGLVVAAALHLLAEPLGINGSTTRSKQRPASGANSRSVGARGGEKTMNRSPRESRESCRSDLIEADLDWALVQFNSCLQDIEIYVIYLVRRGFPSLFE